MFKKIRGKYKSTIRSIQPLYKIYNKEGLILLKRELSLSKLDGDDVSKLEEEIKRYEFKLKSKSNGYSTGRGTGPR